MARNQSRKVFLTGASSGIGLETARLLTAHGCEVWGTSRDPARLPQLPGFHPVTMDLLRPGVAFPRDVPFDVLINNAGAGAFGPLEALPAEIVREQFQVLVEAPLELIRLALPGMHARGRGTIINVTSLAAILPVPFMTPYSAAKAALSSFTTGLRVELAGTPIHVVELRPGDINTAFHEATKRVGPDNDRVKLVWDAEQRHMKAAPPPKIVAETLLRIIEDPNPAPIVTVGGFFQARVATLAARLLPPRLLEWGLHRYYRL